MVRKRLANLSYGIGRHVVTHLRLRDVAEQPHEAEMMKGGSRTTHDRLTIAKTVFLTQSEALETRTEPRDARRELRARKVESVGAVALGSEQGENHVEKLDTADRRASRCRQLELRGTSQHTVDTN